MAGRGNTTPPQRRRRTCSSRKAGGGAKTGDRRGEQVAVTRRPEGLPGELHALVRRDDGRGVVLDADGAAVAGRGCVLKAHFGGAVPQEAIGDIARRTCAHDPHRPSGTPRRHAQPSPGRVDQAGSTHLAAAAKGWVAEEAMPASSLQGDPTTGSVAAEAGWDVPWLGLAHAGMLAAQVPEPGLPGPHHCRQLTPRPGTGRSCWQSRRCCKCHCPQWTCSARTAGRRCTGRSTRPPRQSCWCSRGCPDSKRYWGTPYSSGLQARGVSHTGSRHSHAAGRCS